MKLIRIEWYDIRFSWHSACLCWTYRSTRQTLLIGLSFGHILGTYAPLQLSVEHYHGRHAHEHQHKGINNGLPPAQSRCDNGRYQHEPAEGFAVEQTRVKLSRVHSFLYFIRHLPIVLNELWIVTLGIEQREAGYKHPEYGQFVEQLAQ